MEGLTLFSRIRQELDYPQISSSHVVEQRHVSFFTTPYILYGFVIRSSGVGKLVFHL
jgi:hypothetical protein